MVLHLSCPGKQPIITRYLGHVTGHQPIRDQYFKLNIPLEGVALSHEGRGIHPHCLFSLQTQQSRTNKHINNTVFRPRSAPLDEEEVVVDSGVVPSLLSKLAASRYACNNEEQDIKFSREMRIGSGQCSDRSESDLSGSNHPLGIPVAIPPIVYTQEPTETSKQPIRTRYLGHVTGNQPIRTQLFLIRSVPIYLFTYRHLIRMLFPRRKHTKKCKLIDTTSIVSHRQRRERERERERESAKSWYLSSILEASFLSGETNKKVITALACAKVAIPPIVYTQEPTETSKQPIRTRYLGHVTGNQPIRTQLFLIRSVPIYLFTYRHLIRGFRWIINDISHI
eukprot:sb/3466490/